jgi:hypothetical protein
VLKFAQVLSIDKDSYLAWSQTLQLARIRRISYPFLVRREDNNAVFYPTFVEITAVSKFKRQNFRLLPPESETDIPPWTARLVMKLE